MNKMTLSLAIVCTTLFFSISSFGGGRSDGGANAVVCMDSQNNIQSAELYDLYEGRALRSWSPLPSNDETLTQAVNAAWKVHAATVGGPYPYTIKELYRSLRVLPSGAGLKPVQDATYIAIPKNCLILQLAYYVDTSNDLYVDGDIWLHLDNLNRAALLLHETLYWYLRTQNGEMTSDHTRKAVAAAFAGIELVPVNQGLPSDPEKIERCQILEPRAKLPWAHFYTYQAPDNPQTVIFQFLSLDGKMMLSKTTATFNYLKAWPLSQNQMLSIGSTRISSNVEAQSDVLVKLPPLGSPHTGTIQLGSHSSEYSFTCEL